MARTRLTLTSSAFSHGEPIPARYTCEADNLSPPLRWSHPPEGTASYALIMEDVDADGGRTHWLLFDIPGGKSELAEGGGGAGIPGRADSQRPEYEGPCPPPNHPLHRYWFRLFALDVDSLGLDVGASRQQVEDAMEGHILEDAGLMGRFERRPGRVR